MLKITFMGAGSTVFARNVLGDVMCTPALRQCEIALYDIDAQRLKESLQVLTVINANINENRTVIKPLLDGKDIFPAVVGYFYIMISLVILEKNVIFGTVLLYK